MNSAAKPPSFPIYRTADEISRGVRAAQHDARSGDARASGDGPPRAEGADQTDADKPATARDVAMSWAREHRRYKHG